MNEKVQSRSQNELTVKEGEIPTGRTLGFYLDELFFEPELVEGKRIINLGSGSSNLQKEFEKIGVDCSVTNIDISFDPHRALANKPIRSLISGLINKYSKSPGKQNVIRKIMGTEGRKLAQADMKKLPFADRSFDFAFALYSTYQIPDEQRINAFREMMRVADRIHVSPILKQDLYGFIQLIKSEFPDFEIVCCYPPPISLLEDNQFVIKSESDYDRVMEVDARIYEPQVEKIAVKVINLLIGKIKRVFIKNGYTIILKRKIPKQ